MSQVQLPDRSDPAIQALEGFAALMQQPDIDWADLKAGVIDVVSRRPMPDVPAGVSAADHAASLVDESLEEADDGLKSLRLVLDGLRLNPTYVPGYIVLGNNASVSFQELGLFLLTVALVMSQEELGNEFFEENAGNFGAYPETQPFLQALQGLATVCWDMGDLQTAAKHFATLLDLDPADALNARSGLLSILLEAGFTEGAGDLLDGYDDDSLLWKYGRVLHELQLNGPGPRAAELLALARSANPSVAQYLGGDREIPADFGGNDADVAVLILIDAWGNTPGAAEFLKQESSVEPALAEPPAALEAPTGVLEAIPSVLDASPAAAPPKAKRSGPREID